VNKLETTVQSAKRSKLVIILIVALLVLGTGTTIYYAASFQQLSSLNSTIASLERQVATNQLQTGSGLNSTLLSNSTLQINAVAIYNYANASVVTVEGLQSSTLVLGSGFVVEYSNLYYIVTNFHVVDGDSDLSVTFSNGDAYPATVVGTDPYSDLAVVTTSAPSSEFHPLGITPSSSLKVGESVLAIGNPFGLSSSMTFGIISQLGRTIQETTAGNYPISDAIQISTPINPGNSGGPLFNSNGEVIGITTAIVSGSQGVGFAIPSDTILREVPLLITTGSYNLHPYLGIEEADMSYDLAVALGTNRTYGVLVESIVTGGPAANAGIKGGTNPITVDGQQFYAGGEIIVSVNGTRVVGGDVLSSWLEEDALPNEVVQLGVVRSGSNATAYVYVTLGARPPLS
jgi:S1-C subfamily serine protease